MSAPAPARAPLPARSAADSPIPPRWRALILGVAVAGWLGLAPARAANWPQFRGPAASGLATNVPAVTNWNVATGDNVRWQTPIPGLAHSAPIAWGDQIFVTTAVSPGRAPLKVGLYGDIESVEETDAQQWRVLGLDRATGRIRWNTPVHRAVPRVKRHTKSTHCNSTPATDGRRIVAILGSEGLFCLDLDGQFLWKKDLGPMDSGFYQVPDAQWGFASSPVIRDGRVIVQCDVQKNSFLAAFDLADGRELWRTPRQDVPTWGTPAVIDAGGRTQVVVNGWHQSAGYDFAGGQELWRLNGGGDIPVPTPIFAHDLIYLTSAHGGLRPMRAIRPTASGDITPAEAGGTNRAIAWVHPRQGNYMQTPIVVGDGLYGCADTGVLTAFDARTGSIRFSERLAAGETGFTASPVSDGHHLYFPAENGDVFVVEAAATFRPVGRVALGETCMASPALVDGVLYFRTREKLIAIGRQP